MSFVSHFDVANTIGIINYSSIEDLWAPVIFSPCPSMMGEDQASSLKPQPTIRRTSNASNPTLPPWPTNLLHHNQPGRLDLSNTSWIQLHVPSLMFRSPRSQQPISHILYTHQIPWFEPSRFSALYLEPHQRHFSWETSSAHLAA